MGSYAAADGRSGLLLRRALALLEEPDRWTTGHVAVDASGNEVQPWAASAERWDSVGALLRAWAETCPPDDNRPFLAATAFLRRATRVGERNIALLRWEDDPGRTHRDVLAVLRRAILLADAARPA